MDCDSWAILTVLNMALMFPFWVWFIEKLEEKLKKRIGD